MTLAERIRELAAEQETSVATYEKVIADLRADVALAEDAKRSALLERDEALEECEALEEELDEALARTASRSTPAPKRVLHVNTAAELKRLLTGAALPGDHIVLPETFAYSDGTLKWSASGTYEDPIVLIGGLIRRNPNLPDGPVLEVTASNIIMQRCEVADGSKVMYVRGSQNVSFRECTFAEASDELVHIEQNADGVDFFRCRFFESGLRQPHLGELVYIGTSPKSGAVPDYTKRVVLEECHFSLATGAHIEAKEGTSEVVVKRCYFDLAGMAWHGDGTDLDRGAMVAKGRSFLAVDCTINVPEGMTPPHVMSALSSAKTSVINHPVYALFVNTTIQLRSPIPAFIYVSSNLPRESYVSCFDVNLEEAS